MCCKRFFLVALLIVHLLSGTTVEGSTVTTDSTTEETVSTSVGESTVTTLSSTDSSTDGTAGSSTDTATESSTDTVTGGNTDTVTGGNTDTSTGSNTDAATSDTNTAGSSTDTVTESSTNTATGGSTDTATGDTSTAGSSTDTVTGDTSTAGSSTDTVTGDTSAAGSSTDTVTGDTSTAGSSTDTVTGDTSTAGSSTDTVTGDTSTAGSSTDTVTESSTNTATGGGTDTVTGGNTDTTTGGNTDTTGGNTDTTGGNTDTTTGGSTGVTESNTATSSGDTTTTTAAISTTQREPIPSTKYEVKEPILEGAVYSLVFKITFSVHEVDISASRDAVLKKYNETFQIVVGFKAVVFDYTSNPVRRRRQTQVEVSTTYRSDFDVTSVMSSNKTEFKETVTQAMNVGDVEGIIITQDSGNAAAINALVAATNDLCKASSDVCPDTLQVCNSTAQWCVHRCEYKFCGSNGYCTVVHRDEDGKWQEPAATCQCNSGKGLYEYSGEDCRTETMKWESVLAISGGVGGGVIVILVFLVICACCRRKRRPKSEHFIDGYSEGDQDVYLHDFNSRRSLMRPRYNVGYVTDFTRSNEGYQEVGYDPYVYQGTPERRPWVLVPEGGEVSLEKQERAIKGFQQNLRHVDVDTDYSIKRPQVSSNPIADERL